MRQSASRRLAGGEAHARSTATMEETVTVRGLSVSVRLRKSSLDGTYVVIPWDRPAGSSTLINQLIGDLRASGEEVGAYSLRDDAPKYPVVRDTSGGSDGISGPNLRILAPSEASRRRVLRLLRRYARASRGE